MYVVCWGCLRHLRHAEEQALRSSCCVGCCCAVDGRMLSATACSQRRSCVHTAGTENFCAVALEEGFVFTNLAYFVIFANRYK